MRSRHTLPSTAAILLPLLGATGAQALDLTTPPLRLDPRDSSSSCRSADRIPPVGPDPAAGRCSSPLALQGNRVTAEVISEFMGRAGTTSVNQLMPCLPPELRRNYTLVYDSQSTHAQCSTPESPRLVLFSDDGKTVISVPGDKLRPGIKGSVDKLCNSVEMFEYDPGTTLYSTASVQPGKLPDRDPKNCVSCHGTPFRPKWDQYPRWPGIYGSDDDSMFTGTEEQRKDPATRTALEMRTREKANFQRYLARRESSERYRYLLTPPATGVPPYQDDPKAKTSVFQRPNLRLSSIFTRQNTERVAERMSRTAGFDAIKYKLTARLLGCDNFAEPGSEENRQIEAKTDELMAGLQIQKNRVSCRQLRALRPEGPQCAPREESASSCLPRELRGLARYTCYAEEPEAARFDRANARVTSQIVEAVTSLGIPQSELPMSIANNALDFSSGEIFDTLRDRMAAQLLRRIAREGNPAQLSKYIDSSSNPEASCYARRAAKGKSPGNYVEGSSTACILGLDECVRARQLPQGASDGPSVCDALAAAAAQETGSSSRAGQTPGLSCASPATVPIITGLGPVVAQTTAGARILTTQCASCHQRGGLAESTGILLSSPAAIKQWLRGDPKGRPETLVDAIRDGSMPAGGNRLASPEIEQVRTYLSELKAEL